jgi:hypothetical protein
MMQFKAIRFITGIAPTRSVGVEQPAFGAGGCPVWEVKTRVGYILVAFGGIGQAATLG